MNSSKPEGEGKKLQQPKKHPWRAFNPEWLHRSQIFYGDRSTAQKKGLAARGRA